MAGEPKLLLPWKDHTIIAETVDQVLEAGYESVVVVTGAEWESIQEALGDRPVKFARNLNYRSGMSSSLKAGAAFIDADATAFAIVLGDQPRIRAKTHQLVMANFRRRKKGICVPVYEGVFGHPVIFSIEYRKRMYALQGDQGARGLVEANPDDVTKYELKTPEIISSINTRKDYEEQQEQ
jgi:molybdenum cofactor cytidylyltransferase